MNFTTIYSVITIIGLILLVDDKIPSKNYPQSNLEIYFKLILIIIWPITVCFLFAAILISCFFKKGDK